MADEMKRGITPSKVLLTLGALVLVAVLAVAGWALWLFVGTNVAAKGPTADALKQAESAVVQRPDKAQSEAELPPPTVGEPTWVLEIPKLHLRTAIIAGTTPDDLRRGVGWYPTTNLPGEVGNMAIAGHHTTDGKPFALLQHLVSGDEVIVETSLARYTYEVRVAPNDLTVRREDSWVLEAVPGQDEPPQQPWLTLTTDQDLIPTDDRSVAFAVLTREERR
ncbi:class E sortase [uncultured Tessaracoccus sp.]|uniref:class E sortase n=1 Tax=uncultured Tessaracoccus sp. TaxID=905023 RepID=UPI002611A187|nr:class E sortase [uncultured Tessaracoccus sp.]